MASRSGLAPGPDPRAKSAGVKDRVLAAMFDGPPTPPRLDRYAVLDCIGKGGMGVVYRARDPKLDRDVAIKMLRSDRLDAVSRDRLVSEARAMARLAHPNVVAVYDVDVRDPEQSFVVMELVSGETLERWLGRQRQPAWTVVLDHFLAAGRGLVAAHAAGLLHRDFKPSNVLIGPDGRARVADFGLAALHARPPPEDGSEPAGADDETRVVIGTRGYLAPELVAGGPANPASDQYAFCVSLWFALHGRLPDDHRAPTIHRVPRVLTSALRRGLLPHPDDRWPSMAALLARLERLVRRRRDRALGAGALGLALAAAGAGVLLDDDGSGCDATPLLVDWVSVRANTLEGRLALGDAHERRAWTRIAEELDAYASAWSAARTMSCEAALGRRPVTSVEPVHAMQCLQRARFDFDAALDRLDERLDAERMQAVVDALPPLDQCRAPDHLSVTPPTEGEGPGVAAIERHLAIARSHRIAGDVDAARHSLDLARDAAERGTYAPVRIRTWLEAAELALADGGEVEDANELLATVIREGAQTGQWNLVGVATRLQIKNVGVRLGRPREALQLADMARGLALRSGDERERAQVEIAIAGAQSNAGHLEAALEGLSAALAHTERADDVRPNYELHLELGSLYLAQRKLDQAEAETRVAHRLALAASGPDSLATALTRSNLANILIEQGRLDEATELAETALAIRRRRLPRDHPRLAQSYTTLAALFLFRDDPQSAVGLYRRALAILHRSGRDENKSIPRVHMNIAEALRRLHRWDAAEDELRLAMANLAASVDASHPMLARIHGKLGVALHVQGRDEEAAELLRTTLRQQLQSLGPDHADVAMTRNSLALSLRALGDDEGALEQYRDALRICKGTYGALHGHVATLHANIADVLFEQGALADAEQHYRDSIAALPEREETPVARNIRSRVALGRIALQRGERTAALTILEEQSRQAERIDDPLADAQASFALARARWADGARKDAVAMARRALHHYRGMAPERPTERAAVEAWLEARA